MKKISVLMCLILFGVIVIGCQKNNNNEVVEKKSEVISTHVNEVSADAQFESNIGLASEQPVFDSNGNKIGKKLYVDSSKELLTKESITEFYEFVKETKIDYKEIIISMGNNEALQIYVNQDIEVWYCTVNENLGLTKIKQIY